MKAPNKARNQLKLSINKIKGMKNHALNRSRAKVASAVKLTDNDKYEQQRREMAKIEMIKIFRATKLRRLKDSLSAQFEVELNLEKVGSD